MRNSHRTEQRSNNTVLFSPNQKKGETSGSFSLLIQANLADKFVYISYLWLFLHI